MEYAFPFLSNAKKKLKSYELVIASLPSLCSLMILDLSDCNLLIIPKDFGHISSLNRLDVSGNNFDCLPESIIQLSKLNTIYLRNCTQLRSLPQFSSSIWIVEANGCTSLETLPNRLTLDKLCHPRLFLSSCFKLVDN